MMWNYGYGPMMGWGFGLGSVFLQILSLVFFIILIVALVRMVRGGGRYHRGWQMEDSALQILKERYAKGEINKEEFEAKKKDLA